MRKTQEEASEARAAVQEALSEPAVIAAPVAAPIAVPAEETIPNEAQVMLTCRFTVKATREKLVALRQFLTEGGYEFE